MAKPLFPALANAPSAAADAALAASFKGGHYNVVGPLGEDVDLGVFEFFRADGSCERYSGRSLKGMTWWYWLPEKVALSIEATFFSQEPSAGVSYVARGDRAAGGLIMSGSRLSDFYEGTIGAEVWAKCKELQEAWPDAGVYHAESVEEAERILAASDALQESTGIRAAKMEVARAKRLGALLS